MTVLLFSLPANVEPCAAVMHISRFKVKSVAVSEVGEAATLQELSQDEMALAFTSFPPAKRETRNDNMSTSDFTVDKGNN